MTTHPATYQQMNIEGGEGAVIGSPNPRDRRHHLMANTNPAQHDSSNGRRQRQAKFSHSHLKSDPMPPVPTSELLQQGQRRFADALPYRQT
jgi:hypothetical protein